jgi:superfamily II DNA/RNA helicase
MNIDSWILRSLGNDRVSNAIEESGRRRLYRALGVTHLDGLSDDKLRFVADGLELCVFDLLDGEDGEALRTAAANAFSVARTVPQPEDPIEDAEWLVRLGCLGVLGDRGADVRRILIAQDLPKLPFDSAEWGDYVWACVLDIWLRLFRKNGWDDLDAVQTRVAQLRSEQHKREAQFLALAEESQDVRLAWHLISNYHLARAAEILAIYLVQGSVDGHFDIREQLEAQFDRAIRGASRGQLLSRETLARLLGRTAQVLVDNSIWTLTRAVNSRVTKFVESLVSRQRRQPIFEMLPPQRRTLREEGLLGSGHRSVVVCLPTSSGKTFIAEFRILQALNQFDQDHGWVAYLAPTRALVNQLTLRLRREFSHRGIIVEKVSPALEIDGLEAVMLTDREPEREFSVLVTTPEKLDLLIRGGWEEKIGRPLTLVVVDEAHGLASENRGLRLELLLATINRDCRNSQFLLLTPFIRNAQEISRWLSPDSHKSIELAVDWSPNDRVIAIAHPEKGHMRGDFGVTLETLHTTRNTIVVPELLDISGRRSLGLSWSQVSNSPGKLAAAVAHVLQRRGAVIVLVDKPKNTWGVAKMLEVEENRIDVNNDDLNHIQQFLIDEMGQNFPLISMLEYGVAVHHGGLSEDTRMLVEWLMERSKLRVLVATTTIAQGVNFPVSGVVFASYQYPYGQDMPPEDFWNIAGRAGRVDQGDLGIVALTANNHDKDVMIKKFVSRAVDSLNSTLVDMVKEAEKLGKLLNLKALAVNPCWSAFLQYLAHTYRQIGDHERFAAEIEQVLRGTLGFQKLHKTNRSWADALVSGVYKYAEGIKGKPLKLVDATGLSWESVIATLRRLGDAKVKGDVWSPGLFGERRGDLQRMMGILLKVPELREQLTEVTGGENPDGDTLSNIICDWVQGCPLTEMAAEYFSKKGHYEDEDEDGHGDGDDKVGAITRCCQKVFGRLTQTASWGLAALQSLTIGDAFEDFSDEEQRILRNIPARVYYGVNTDEAIALRILGVPRSAAIPLAHQLQIKGAESLDEVRAKLLAAGVDGWKRALGLRGESHYRVWCILEGEDR